MTDLEVVKVWLVLFGLAVNVAVIAYLWRSRK